MWAIAVAINWAFTLHLGSGVGPYLAPILIVVGSVVLLAPRMIEAGGPNALTDESGESNECRVVVTRPAGLRDIWRSYKVFIDGKRVGKVRQEHQLPLIVAAGSHTFKATIDGFGSPRVPFHASRNGTVHITVEPAGAMLAVWAGIKVAVSGGAEESGE